MHGTGALTDAAMTADRIEVAGAHVLRGGRQLEVEADEVDGAGDDKGGEHCSVLPVVDVARPEPALAVVERPAHARAACLRRPRAACKHVGLCACGQPAEASS